MYVYVVIVSLYTFIYSLYTCICSSSSSSSSSSYMIYDCVWRCIAYLKSLWNTSHIRHQGTAVLDPFEGLCYTQRSHSWEVPISQFGGRHGSPHGDPWRHNIPLGPQPRSSLVQGAKGDKRLKTRPMASTKLSRALLEPTPGPGACRLQKTLCQWDLSKKEIKKAPRSPRQKTNLWWSSRSTVCETVR